MDSTVTLMTRWALVGVIVGPGCVLIWVTIKIATTRLSRDRVESRGGLASMTLLMAVFSIPLWPAALLLLDGRIRALRAMRAAARIRAQFLLCARVLTRNEVVYINRAASTESDSVGGFWHQPTPGGIAAVLDMWGKRTLATEIRHAIHVR